MWRLARVVIVGYPCHVTHRGNRRCDVFFTPKDRDRYRAYLSEYAAKFQLDVWAYCLMTNHAVLAPASGREMS
jgi:putative transposase